MTLYRGDYVLEMKPGDLIPTELSGPFAVHVDPPLAEYFLTLNECNRPVKTKVAQYAADMVAGRWAYPSTSFHFDDLGKLKNGQNRLLAVGRAQTSIWNRVEFGWDNGSLDVMDQGSSRTAADVFHYHGVKDKNSASAMVALVHRYDATAPTSRPWSNPQQGGYQPSAPESLSLYTADEGAYRTALSVGRRLCHALDQGLTPAVWAGAYYICARNSPELTPLFFEQVIGADGHRSDAAQLLRDYQMRRRVKDSKSGDVREPLENILRAFKAHTEGKRPSFVRMAGFNLTIPPKVF